MKTTIKFSTMPKTQLSFVNVPIVPVRTRAGERRFLCATCGGAMHLFDERGNEKVIPYPAGGQGSYSFVADPEDGFAWVVCTGGVIARIDVGKGECDFVEPVPLKELNWGAAITREGLLVCEASPGDVMVYDTRARRVKFMITPISPTNHYGHNPRALSDGRVIVPMSTPGKELVLLDPRTGRFESFVPRVLQDLTWFPRSLTVLPDGRFAIPRETRVLCFECPLFAEAPALEYPRGHDGPWETFRDFGDGRLFAWPKAGGPLFALDGRCEWATCLDRFAPRVGRADLVMFAAVDGRRILGLSLFGEVAVWERDGSARQVAQLDNLGRQRISALAPGDGSQVFTTTFINASCQEMDWRTGRGRNIRPCQEHAGQASCAVCFDGKLWLAGYGGAEINCYDPTRPGEWPENPRPVARIGEEQMRPTGLAADGRFLWCTTHAHYGKLGGALSRIDPRTGACTVWRHLVRDHNLTGLAVDAPRGRVYVGTEIYADCESALPAQGPAAVAAFDAKSEKIAWLSRPDDGALQCFVIGIHEGRLLARGVTSDGASLITLDPADGRLVGRSGWKPPAHWTQHDLFIGGDGGLYVATAPDGLFRYDPARGLGERLAEGPVTKPVVRGRDLFFIRGNELGVALGLW